MLGQQTENCTLLFFIIKLFDYKIWSYTLHFLSNPIEDKDVMVIGKRKPFLNSKADVEKLQKYEKPFSMYQEKYRMPISNEPTAFPLVSFLSRFF